MTYRLNQKKKSILVAIHVLAVASWIGGTLAMLLLAIYLQSGANGEQLLYTMASMEVIDENLLKYPALLSLITGIMLSVWTQWGLTKYYWVIIKLVLTILTILIGIFFLNKWTASLGILIEDMGFIALKNEEFQHTWTQIVTTSSFNILCLAFMTFITYLKPFGKVKKK
ncbi:hypothetical protein [Neobacillus thermocopriae]|uniref:DUF2269 family protein n=1 Tax=Neobacillus thermocopriae TaxID=1215031 RepID=A0A6B3TSN8_9BACI|nr:hypothetical protein [Neobacillus thermocopriae]MED3624443.1 hypothetical protein [Neobacillus thermocopriae]MED3714834.1 hypothetical protein [Neobacillus thermocopriae]NEX78727.1 hypothetical protein [Neobacillus thermocopriae]